MSSMLSVKDLTISHDLDVLVEPVSFHAMKGRALVLLGETGSGKSLLANAIIGNLPKNLLASGEVTLFGQKQSERTESQREALWGKSLSVLPQEPWFALSPIMQVGEQIKEVDLLVNNIDKQQATSRVQEKLDSVELGNDSQKLPSELSGGMAQRIAYLCATQAGGELLIADEPTKGLDVALRDQIIQQLKAQLDVGGVVVITHDIELAYALGGDVIVMKKGVVQEQGETHSVLSNPQSDYAKALIAAHPKHWQIRHQASQLMPLLTIEKLSMERGGKRLFSELSFDVMQRGVVGISGPSGSGKSTMADIMLGLVAPTSGQVTYHQTVAKGEALKLYQDPPSALARSAPLKKLLKDLRKLSKFEDAEVDHLMARLSLSKDLLERKATQVSGGELQRFAILRTLLMRPKLLIADEPTSRLDPITAANTLQLLVELCQDMNCALVLISHDKLAMYKLCDQVVEI